MPGLYPQADVESKTSPPPVYQSPTNGEMIPSRQQPSQKSNNVSSSKSQLPKYVDEPGPKEQRKCQDVFFLILFIVFWIGMFAIGGFAVRDGNFAR